MHSRSSSAGMEIAFAVTEIAFLSRCLQKAQASRQSNFCASAISMPAYLMSPTAPAGAISGWSRGIAYAMKERCAVINFAGQNFRQRSWPCLRRFFAAGAAGSPSARRNAPTAQFKEKQRDEKVLPGCAPTILFRLGVGWGHPRPRARRWLEG